MKPASLLASGKTKQTPISLLKTKKTSIPKTCLTLSFKSLGKEEISFRRPQKSLKSWSLQASLLSYSENWTVSTAKGRKTHRCLTTMARKGSRRWNPPSSSFNYNRQRVLSYRRSLPLKSLWHQLSLIIKSLMGHFYRQIWSTLRRKITVRLLMRSLLGVQTQGCSKMAKIYLLSLK